MMQAAGEVKGAIGLTTRDPRATTSAASSEPAATSCADSQRPRKTGLSPSPRPYIAPSAGSAPVLARLSTSRYSREWNRAMSVSAAGSGASTVLPGSRVTP
jgi:hypothetical protein